MEKLELAQRLAEDGDLDNAYRLADQALRQDPDNAQWLLVMSYVLLASHKPAIAYSVARHVTQVKPKNAGGWLNFGMACNDLWKTEESIRYYKRALKFSTSDEQRSMLHVNLASVYIDTGRFIEGEKHCHLALQHNAESVKAVANLGFCQLAQRNWAEGWKNYHKTIGCEWRPKQVYNNEPEWDGKSEGNIVLWADQGLGDVISFASMVPDITKDHRVILDVDKRLEGLFRRSFPGAVVYGTRGQKQVAWSKSHRDVHYSLPLGQCGEFYRNSDEDFPGTPYLKADPDRVLQWKALFESKRKPVIGIAWSGGIDRTGARFRRVDLDALLPVLQSVEAHWVSLQYKPAGKEIVEFRQKHPDIDLVEYPHGTLTNDYDDTVAMVAAMDHVVAMHTTVVHAAGGLGIPCLTLVPMNSQWRYGQGFEDFVWANSVRLLRQTRRGYWDDVIEGAAEELRVLFSGISEGANVASQGRQLRRDGTEVRLNGVGNRRQAGDRPTA